MDHNVNERMQNSQEKFVTDERDRFNIYWTQKIKKLKRTPIGRDSRPSVRKDKFS